MENNYITGGVGYIALLAAIIEQARKDANGKNEKDARDAERGISEWADVAMEDINFKCYE